MMRNPALLASLALLATGCLEVKSGEPPMCKTTADCDAGETCEESVCWGNPPDSALAAILSPPRERADLVSREVMMLPIAGDGWIDDMRFETAITFKGRMSVVCGATACSSRSRAASITVTRPSVFPGGPGFRRPITVEDDDFEIKLPPTRAGDPPFTFTVVPGGRDAPGTETTFAGEVPPQQITLALAPNATSGTLELGGATLPRITGTITMSGGTAQQGYRVVALGRWAADQPATEVSTVDFTGFNGEYELKLARGLFGPVELVAKPIGTTPRPELRAGGLPSDRDSAKSLVVPSTTPGAETAVTVVVEHKDTGGGIVRVAGARVIVSSTASETTGLVRYAAEGTTNNDGVVQLKILNTPPLATRYALSIIPPPSSKAAALFEKPFAIQPTTLQRLATRIAITGAIHDAEGNPVQDVSVTAQPSVRFLWSLDADPQAFLNKIPASTAVTTDKGEFVLFVDHALPSTGGAQGTTVWGSYDLAFEPPAGRARVPSWTRPDLELPRDAGQTAVALGALSFPDAAYVRGHVFDDGDARVEGAEVKLYRIQRNDMLCEDTRFEPQGGCPIPPLLMGRGVSDDDGVVRLTLPRLAP